MHRILCLEDNPVNILFLKKLFTSHKPGTEVIYCYDAMTAIENYDLSSFNLIITDQKMPIVDGISFIIYLRDSNLKTPIILVSSESPVNNIFASDLKNVKLFERFSNFKLIQNYENVYLLSKPLSPDHFFAVIDNLLKYKLA